MDSKKIEKAQTTLNDLRDGKRPRLAAAKNLVREFYKGHIMMTPFDIAELKKYFGCVECLNRA